MLRARLGEGERARRLLDLQLHPILSGDEEDTTTGGGSYTSLLCAHPPFQIDGNLSVCDGIMEMLVRQRGNNLYLLPALPKSWDCGCLNGIALKGGAFLNLAWEAGRVTKAEIFPKEKEDSTCL